MLQVFMLPRARGRTVLGLVLLFSGAALSCEKVPLLAPTGSTIVLTAGNTALPTNSSLTIVAQVTEASGTPPHSGTRITFTTSLGTIEPASADTDINGQVAVTFQSGTSNGTATITAFSGGATTGSTGALKIAIGTAAVGRVTLTANPNIIPANGGISVITANVADLNGNILSSVPVNFATSAGALGSAVVNTNSAGVATTTLNTTVAATVTATVGVSSSGTGTGTGGSTSGQVQATVTVTVNPVPNVSVSTSSGTLTAGSPITFTISVQPAAGSSAQIRSVDINFGDGVRIDLGAVSGTNLSVQHSYTAGGNYTVRVTATDFLNATTSAATAIVVLPQAPMSVVISSSRTVSGTDANFTFTATVTPSTTIVSNYTWTFGDASPSVVTSSPQTTHTYTVGSGSKNVTVTATATTGQTANTSIFITP